MTTTLTETNTIQDIVKFETDAMFCRESCDVYAGAALAVGDICQDYSSSDDAKKQVLVASAVNAVQTLTFSGTPTGGTFVIWVPSADGTMVPTTAIAFNASATTISTALNVATGVSAGIVATGTTLPDHVITLTYSGTGYAGLPQQTAVVDITLSTGGAAAVSEVSTVTGAVAEAGDEADSICLVPATCVNEVQSIVMGGTPSGGTFTLSLTDKTGTVVETTAIAYNASAATITTAVDVALDEAGQCVVTGTTLPDHTLTATWSGASYSGRPQEMIVTDLLSQTGGTGTYGTSTVSETTEGEQGESVFLTRGPAVVDHAYLDYNSCTEATVNTALAALGIIVRTGPTYA